MRAKTACLALGIAVTACAVGRKDVGGLRPHAAEATASAPDAHASGASGAIGAGGAVSAVSAVDVGVAGPGGAPASSVASSRSPGVRDRNAPPRAIGRCADRDGAKARFTIAHLNDLQARYSDRLAGKSRYAYIAGWLRRLKEEIPATLVLDAGDDYEKGAVVELRSNGETTRQMIQALPIDVRTIGNHDFAYGEDAVLRDVRLSAHPVLAANVRHSRLGEEEQPFERFVRFDVGCVKIGVIGLVTQNFGADDQPTKAPYDGVFEHDARYAEVLSREIGKHRAEVDVLVALTHLGLWDDSVLATHPSTKGLDLVVGAHTEDLLQRPLSVGRPDGSRTWIVQAGHFGRNVGRADFAFDRKEKKLALDKYRIVDVDAALPSADDVAELADRLEREIAPDAQRPIASAEGAIERRAMPELLFRSAAATWRADALLVGKDLFWEGLPRGPITLQRLYDAVLVQRQPAGTTGFSSIWVVEMTGAELERYKSRFRAGGTYALFAPPKIDPSKRYRVAMDKRVLTYPRTILGDKRLGDATYAGEMIDALEAYARARTAEKRTLD